MRRFFISWIAAAVLCAGAGLAPSAAAQSAAAEKPEAFARYQIVIERNIFDPNRRPRTRAETGNTEPVEQKETINLVGTWISNRELLAFLEGSRPEHTGASPRGAEFDGWQLTDINAGRVVIEKEGRKIEWPVGHRLERSPDGEWELGGTATAVSSRPSRSSPGGRSSASGGGTSSAASTAPSPAQAEDLLQRMRERRQRETRQ